MTTTADRLSIRERPFVAHVQPHAAPLAGLAKSPTIVFRFQNQRRNLVRLPVQIDGHEGDVRAAGAVSYTHLNAGKEKSIAPRFQRREGEWPAAQSKHWAHTRFGRSKENSPGKVPGSDSPVAAVSYTHLVFARASEHRINKPVRSETRLANQSTKGFGAPQASRPMYGKRHARLAAELRR